jgi:hypothetical protein
MAVGPGGRVYVGYMVAGGIVLAVSHDGGRTFDHPFAYTAPGSGNFSGDVALAADNHGDAYLTWIDYISGTHPAATSRVMLLASHDGGATWEGPSTVFVGTTASDAVSDRPWIAIGADRSVVVQFSFGSSFDRHAVDWQSAVVRSTDRGQSFAAPVVLAAPTGGRIFGAYNGVADVANVTLSPYAEVGANASFGTYSIGLFALAREAKAARRMPLVTFGEGGVPSEAYAAAAGSTATTCFAYVGSDASDADGRVQFARSTDGAQTFGPFRRLGPPTSFATKTTVVADPSGSCAVLWIDYGTQKGGQVLSAIVDREGRAIDIGPVNDRPMNLGNTQTASGEDYLSAAAVDRRAYVTWVDLRSMPPAVYLSFAAF